MYRRQRHIYDLTRKFYLLGRDELIAELAPPPGGARARDRLRHRPQPHPRRRAYPRCARLWHRHFRRNAGDRAARRSGAPACRARIARRAGRRDGVRSAERCSASRLRSGLHLLRAVDDPAVAGRGRARRRASDARRLAAHRRFRRPAAGFPPRFASRLRRWLELFRVHPRVALERELAAFAAGAASTLAFRPLYRRYAFLAR